MQPNQPPRPRLARQDLEKTLDGPTGRLEHWTEQVIKEAERRGDFDHLPGKGKPLQIDEYDPYAGEEAQAYKILKNAGFVPEWVELRATIAKEIAWLRTAGRDPLRPSRIVEVNVLIQQHNRLVPKADLALPKVPSNFGLER